MPSITSGAPWQRWPGGTKSAGAILGSAGVGDDGEGAGVGATIGTFCHTLKPALAKKVSQDAKAEQAPFFGLKIAKVHRSSDRQAALQDSCDKPFPKFAQVLPRSFMGKPAHLSPSGTCEARTIS